MKRIVMTSRIYRRYASKSSDDASNSHGSNSMNSIDTSHRYINDMIRYVRSLS